MQIDTSAFVDIQNLNLPPSPVKPPEVVIIPVIEPETIEIKQLQAIDEIDLFYVLPDTDDWDDDEIK